jgi:hypothetical protein
VQLRLSGHILHSVYWQDVDRRYTAAKERGDSLLLAP